MSTETNKAIVRRFAEAINAQRPEVFDEVATPELAPYLKGASSWAQATYGEVQIEIMDIVAEGDIVMTRFVARGGHTATWEGIPATGKHWSKKGFAYSHIADGKIVALDFVADDLGLLKQLGAIILPPTQRTV
jgi:predicted ester cyclase